MVHELMRPGTDKTSKHKVSSPVAQGTYWTKVDCKNENAAIGKA